MNSAYLCNLIVPGAAKSGTSTLHDALNQHPKVCMSDHKEPHHFSRFENYLKGPEHHNSLFSQASGASVFGESSTSYMPWPDAIDKISKDLENPKVIIVLRDPISRTFSHWRWRVKLGLEERSLMQAIKLDGYGYNPAKPDGFGFMAYLQFSNYSKYCPLWIEKFGDENVLILSQSDLDANFQDTMTKCFSFLELDNFIFKNVVRSNETSSIGASPKPFIIAIMKLLPRKIGTISSYRKWRSKILKFSSPHVSNKISEQEHSRLAAMLDDDINYFRSVTG